MEIEEELLTKIYDLRHRLHSIPEASMHETQTKEMLMSFLKENTDLEIVDRGAWFYAVLKSPNDRRGDENNDSDERRQIAEKSVKRPPIAFRADMDAVCGQDGKPGHYCGHDGHSSILCGAAVVLSHAMEKCGNVQVGDRNYNSDEDCQTQVKGCKCIDPVESAVVGLGKVAFNRDIYFIFQPGEETGAGAKLCRELIAEKNIGEIYGLHNIPGYPRDHVLTIDGTFACASTGLEIHMTGAASHAAYPEAGKNPGPALARLLLEVEKLTEEYNRSGGFVRMTLIGMDVGSANYGVAASEGTLRMTVRAEREKVFAAYVDEIKQLARTMADDGEFELDIQEIERFPATENHAENVDKLRKCAAKQNIVATELAEPMRWSEDFGYYLQATNGAFFGVGDGEKYAQLHTAGFEFPDEIIETAVKMFVGLALM